MKKPYITAILSFGAIVASASAMAEPACNPGAEVKPVWESIKAFEAQGGKVEKFKINSGKCYEIYGSYEGQLMEVFFDPNTSQEIDRINQ